MNKRKVITSSILTISVIFTFIGILGFIIGEWQHGIFLLLYTVLIGVIAIQAIFHTRIQRWEDYQ